MEKIIITTDSGMDPIDTEFMAAALVNRNDGESFEDVHEINSKNVLQQMQEGYTFKTSAPALRTYQMIFTKALDQADRVIHLSMGNGISSASVLSSLLIAEEIDENRITVLDSKTGATGGTLLERYAKYLVKMGLPHKEIVAELIDCINHMHTSFFVPNPQGFIRSGRDKSKLCLKEKALMLGSKALMMAGVKYRVDFNEEGNLYAKQLLRGKSSVKAMEMIQEIVNDKTIQQYDSTMAIIGTVLEDTVDMTAIQLYLEQYFDKVYRQDINSVVAAYGSPDLIGISLKKVR